MKALMRTILSGLAVVAFIGCDGGPEPAAQADAVVSDAAADVTLKVREKGPEPDLRKEVVEVRKERRMYDGAPPRIPHTVNTYQEDCLSCHGNSANLGGQTVPTMSHPEMIMCRQCHLEQVSPTLGQLPEGFLDVPNSFVGLKSAGKGLPVAAGAPPRVPHPTWFRGRCNACHGKYAREGLKSPHPQRRACEQCHIPFAELNQLMEMPAGLEAAAP